IEQAFHARNRRSLADEIRKPHVEASTGRAETSEHALMHRAKPGEIEWRAAFLEDLDEPRHMRALDVVREPNVHPELGDRVLHRAFGCAQRDRIAQALDAHA